MLSKTWSCDRAQYSYALALILNEKPDKIGEASRTHQLEKKLAKYDEQINLYPNAESIEPAMKTKFDTCSSKTYETIEEDFNKMDTPIRVLPPAQREGMKKLIVNRALEIAKAICDKKPISVVVKRAIDITSLDVKKSVTKNYAGVFDEHSSDADLTIAKARMELGLITHIISDKTLATGFSCKSILNTQIFNAYTTKVEDDINVINGALSLAQAAGRPVRASDVEARVQQYIDKRYEGLHLITTIDDIIHPVSAPKIKKVMIARSSETGSVPSDKINQCPIVEQLDGDIKKQETLLSERCKLIATYTKKLHHAETVLSVTPGDKLGPTPKALLHDKEMALQWQLRKMLPNAIKKLQVECDVIDKNVKELQEKRPKLIRKASISLASPERQISTDLSEIKLNTGGVKKKLNQQKKEQVTKDGSATHKNRR